MRSAPILPLTQNSAEPQKHSVPGLGQRIAAQIEHSAHAGAALLLILFSLWAWHAARGRPFQFDELLEIAAASAPTMPQVLSSLAAGVDFNPPLSHWLVRLSRYWFGNEEWAARLPAFLGVLVLLSCLYHLVSKNFNRTYALVAMLVVLCLPVRAYAVEARPYGLVLGLSGCALLLYGAAVRGSHRFAVLPALAFCTAALVASHYYAVLVVGVLVASEFVRAWKRLPLDWPLLAACAAPPLLVLWMLESSIHQQRGILTNYFARGNLFSFIHGYDELALDPLVTCLALLLLTVYLVFDSKRRETTWLNPPGRGLSSEALVPALGLLSLPLVGALVTQFVTHAYVPRYFLPAAIGFCLCLSQLFGRLSRVIPSLILIVLLALGVGFGKALLQELLRAPETVPTLANLPGALPVLFDTPGMYEQVRYYSPALKDNLWVLADPVASMHYRQYDTDDRIMLALAERGQAQTITLSEAVRRWSHFRLLPRSADSVGALQCLLQAQSRVQIDQTFGPANFVFDVQIPAESISRIQACVRP